MPIDTSQEYEWQTKVHAQLISDYRETEDKRFQVTNQLNKTMINLSAGTLALSMTLVAEVFKSPTNIYLLKASWVSFGTTLILLIVGTFISTLGLKKQLAILINYYNETMQAGLEKSSSAEIKHKPNPYNKWLMFLNILVGATFVTSYFLLGAFVLANY